MSGRFLLVVLLSLSRCALAQPEFESASLKVAPPPDGHGRRVGMTGGPGTSDPGRIDIMNLSLKGLVTMAYHLNGYQVFGPDWIQGQAYNIVATLPKGTTKDDLDQMLRKLLVDRFQLVVHHEQKQMAVYRLEVAKGGSKLKAPAPDPGSPEDPAAADGPPAKDRDGYPILPRQMGMAIVGGKGAHARAQAFGKPIVALLQLLERQLGCPVVDATALTGEYDYVLSRIPTPPGTGPTASDAGPDLFTAVREQLGLRLMPAKESVDVLIIDSANKTPIAN